MAARAFSDGGYHAVRLDDIAEVAGVSTPALYRHFPNKYALFAEATSMLANRLSVATAQVEAHPGDPRAELSALLSTISAVAVENRSTGGLYRWESRYLTGSDADLVRDVVVTQHRRLRSAALRARPELSRIDADLLVSAMTSVVASPATHRASLPARAMQIQLSGVAADLLDADLPPPVAQADRAAVGLAPTAKRETILTESIRLFANRGFHEVTIEDIGYASGIPASAVYRHFPNKAAILEAALWRAADRTTTVISEALAVSHSPREALVELVRRYVELSCADAALIGVYESEFGHLRDSARIELRRRQRITVDEWATWVTRDREIGVPTARLLAHAALATVADLVRGSHSPDSARVTAIATRILLGSPRSRTMTE